ncbi:MAG: MBL fold metallo-hydrolase [Chloroflexi bacterium]|nr:MBL fold metallo-hydrolase [Chloroflexota bacterium]
MIEVQTIDLHYLGRPLVIASYVLESNDGLVMIETGPGSTLTAAQSALQSLGYKVEDVRHVLLTHIHLDHAGAAGWWARQGAHVYVHHFGARHLIDPSKLMASATRIYGDQMERMWGEMLPVPAGQLTELHEGDVLKLGGLQFEVWETAGHALHHMAFVLGKIAFTGDVAGTRVPGFSLVDAPTPPPEFDLEVWRASLDRLLAADFIAIYPTHFGRVENVAAQLQGVRVLIGEVAEFVRERMVAGVTAEQTAVEYREWYRARAMAAGVSEEAFATLALSNAPEMTVNGVWRYWSKR